MIILKLGDDLAAVCDRCLKCEVGSFALSKLREFRLNHPLLCRNCDKVVQSRARQLRAAAEKAFEQGNDKDRGQTPQG